MTNKTIHTAELSGRALDWAVTKCEGANDAELILLFSEQYKSLSWKTMFSGSWALSGPIIERAVREVYQHSALECWAAKSIDGDLRYGPTLLIAAMRCYVASKLGDTVEVPANLA